MKKSTFQHDEKMLFAELGARGKHRLTQIGQLIECGVNLNCLDDKGLTPLYFGKFK